MGHGFTFSFELFDILYLTIQSNYYEESTKTTLVQAVRFI